jgi:hypothetical protein
MTSCLQYYYDNPEDIEKYKISCDYKPFPELNDSSVYTHKKMLNFIRSNYSSEAFPEDSPFEFKADYINLSNDEICKSSDMSLGPQQKFMGQLLGPNTNFNNTLIFHGLGSGKSCTSIVIAEALKNATNERVIFTVPAPLVDQYYEEISGEMRNGKFFSCPSFCLVKNGGKTERDFYVSQQNNSMLLAKMRALRREEDKLNEITETVDDKKFRDQQNKVTKERQKYNEYQKKLRDTVKRTFDIVSHQTFVQSIYRTDKKTGNMSRGDRLKENSALFNKNGLLIIDEIQRLVSADGTFYKKLYNCIKYYFHPNLKLAIMSATPVYDNPYELALTINLLRPRLPFPLNSIDFYKNFIGEIRGDGCAQNLDSPGYLNEDACVINKDLLSHICSGYISYFKGGNPNAYPYKRIITMEHDFSQQHKQAYIEALRSDASKDKKFGDGQNQTNAYENLLLGNITADADEIVTGMYVTTQQYCNIALPKHGADINKTEEDKKKSLRLFKEQIIAQRLTSIPEVLEYIKQFSAKFANIIELSLNSSGPVFIFSNWLTYGVEPLSIILEACGLGKFGSDKTDKLKYFIWSSETKAADKDGILINNARNTFNSLQNADGSLIKIILGTRSVMEGVSFKNVKQVHITDPWWNESRIEQILARASRYCSHSNLPYEEQYVDIYRHYSTLPTEGSDPDVARMLQEVTGRYNFWELDSLSIEQRMLTTSLRKNAINKDIEMILKNCSIDAEINKDGNLIRLEEYISPVTGGMYQIFYKNPSNLKMYIRDGIPETVTFAQVYSREFTYPRQDLMLTFAEAGPDENGILKIYEDDPEIIDEDNINKDLILRENIVPWDSDKTLEEIEVIGNIKQEIKRIKDNYNLLPSIRKTLFNQQGDKTIKFPEDKNYIKKFTDLIKCIRNLAKEDISSGLKKEIIEKFTKESKKQKINMAVLELVYKYNIYTEDHIEMLLEIGATDPKSIFDTLKEAKSKK